MIELLERLLSSLASLATIACFILEVAKEIRFLRKDGKGNNEKGQR